MSRTERKFKAISLILVAVLVFTVIFNLAYVGNTAFAGGGFDASSSVAGNNTFVQSDMNFDSIREQYFNQELVQLNTASYDGDRWVIVKLAGATLYDRFKASTRYNDFTSYVDSVEGQQAEKSMKITHTEFLKKLQSRGIDFQLKYSYTAITNGVAIKVNADALNAIKKMSGVEGVYFSEYYDVPKVIANNDTNVYTTGIYDSHDLPVQGDGMVVAILDTGLDHTHEAFQTMPKNGAWDLDYIETKVAEGKLNAQGIANDFYYNQKVPFAYDYADDDPNVYPSYSSHGTHVAGIVAGSSNFPIADGEEGETFIGVAPNAQLMICKVFTDNLESKSLGGANSMGIIAALEDCVTLGVDVINMSLGSSAGFSVERGADDMAILTNEVYGKIHDAGISLIVAASNDYSSGFGGGNGTNLASNPDSGTVGSPSTYEAALSVASINGQKSAYIQANNTRNNGDNPIAFITNANDEFSREINFIDELYKLASKRKGKEIAKGTDLKFKYVVVSGVGKDSNYTNAILRELSTLDDDVYGAIALVKRGDNTFEEKVLAAMGAKADAIIIYNNVAGTIRMSIGDIDDPIPTCSISMDAGKAFVDLAGRFGVGYLTVNSTYEAGPFMSEFSSWGPTPNLELKPEITAHGGQITSAVAGGYDKLSGTSMASPNMAGAVALLRQYLKNSEEKLSGYALNARVNQVLMSTATIAKNEENNPYSPRKQGAGLGSIQSAIASEAYITVQNDKGEIRDKTKIELKDDSSKNGVYKLKFIINNITNEVQGYKPTTYVMTETMSSDNKTVAEKAYMLTDLSKITYKTGSDFNTLADNNGTIQVQPKSTLAVEVTVTLGSQAKNYLDTNFKNGMYVEGFVSLANTVKDRITIGLPYLAFYGDWTDAPLFDYDQYEIAADEMDTNIPAEEKIKASAAATTPVGLYYEDKYLMPLGTYIYSQNELDVQVYPEREKIAVSVFDDNRGHSFYELYMLYAGMLRGASEMDLTITDDATGTVIYSDLLYNIRKSYSGGGSNRGAPIMIEINPLEWGMQNNSTYSVHVEGRLDYEMPEGKKLVRDSFDFPFTVDTEAPELLDYRIRYMSYTENKVVKYRIFMDLDVRDNQYVQAVLPCYRESRPTGIPGETENVLTPVTEYAIPVMGQKGETSTVSFEITDIYEEFVKTGKLYIEIDDYALNSNNYQILLGMHEGEDAMGDPDTFEFVEDEYLAKKSNTPSIDDNGNKYYQYELNLPGNTLYTFNAITSPENVLMQGLVWTSQDESVAIAKGNEIYARGGGRTRLKLENTTQNDGKRRTYASVTVNIVGANGKEPVLASIDINAAIDGNGVAVSFTGPNAADKIELNPNQVVDLTWNWSPWYAEKPAVKWTTSNSKVVEVTEDGKITAIKKGNAYITVTAVDRPSVSTLIKVEVGREYDVRSYTLYNYYGTGDIQIRDDLNIMYLSEYCFKGNTSITKVKLPDTLTEIPENAFMGCTALEEIIIPGQCVTIKENAFAGCTSLKKITLGKFVDSEHNSIGDQYAGTLSVGRNAFLGCSALNEIENQQRITTLYTNAFADCTALESIDLSELRVVTSGVFKGCTNLKTVITNKNTVLGYGMFEGCTSLASFDFYASSVPAALFSGCTALENVTFHEAITSIGANAFDGTKITNVTLPNGTINLAANAFANSTLATLTLSANTELSFETFTPFDKCSQFMAYALSGESNFYTVDDGNLYNKDKTTLVAVPYGKTEITLPNTVKSIASGALAGVSIASIPLNNVKNIGSYAFAGNTAITSIVLPSGLKAIPEGLFYGCENLESVTAADNFAEVVSIGDNAFKNCAKLTAFAGQNVEKVGESAFENSKLTAIAGAKIKTVGKNAFANSKLVNISMLNLESAGDSAFANISTLKTVALGPVKNMGDALFVGSTEITSVSFAEGTEKIAFGTFASLTAAVGTAITVTLPASVTIIEPFAFYNRTGLTAIDLSHVVIIDAQAFLNTRLTSVDLSSAEQIGFGAFAYTRLASVNLPKAWIVADSVFYGVSTLKSVKFDALERIGSSVFAGTSITTITLPDTFNKRTHKEDATIFDKETKLPDHVREREEVNYTPGAFSGATKLTEIKANNEAFFDIDGVLYSKVENGLVLEQYPAAREGKEYKVADNTVIIADSAFMGVSVLEEIELPYTVKTIGSYAFMNCSVKKYTFNSVDAPTLLATAWTQTYEELYEELGNEILAIAFGRDLIFSQTNFYANFSGFAVLANEQFWKSVYATIIDGTYEDAKELAIESVEEYANYDLTMTIPRNARGYNEIWKLFFKTIKYTEDIMPDDTTHRAMEAIAKLPTVEEINAKTSIDQINVASAIGQLAQQARKAYNAIVIPDQRALVEDEFDTLVKVEKALRDKKEALGHKVQISSLVMSQRPNKIVYEIGEAFDSTEMVLTAIYEDGSEVALDGGNYTVSPSTMKKDTSVVTITYRDGNQSVTTEVRVQVNSYGDEPGVDETQGLDKGAIIGIAVGATCAVLVIVGIVVVLVLMKKKKSKTDNGDDNGADADSDDTAKLPEKEGVSGAELQAENAQNAEVTEGSEQETPATEPAEEPAEETAPATTENAEETAEESVDDTATESEVEATEQEAVESDTQSAVKNAEEVTVDTAEESTADTLETANENLSEEKDND